MPDNLSHTNTGSAQLFTPLGHARLHFYFRTSLGKAMWFDSMQLTRLGVALALVPNLKHWQTNYPLEGGRPGSVNWTAVGADLLRMAQEAGEYEPSEEEGPRGGGRPRLPYGEALRRYQERQAARKARRAARPAGMPAELVA